MTHQDAIALLDYHYWARDRLLEAVVRLPVDQFTRDLGSSFPSIRNTLGHMHAAEAAWLARWKGESPSGFPPLDRFPDAASVVEAWRTLEAELRAFIGDLDDAGLRRVVEYRTFAGTASASVLWHMLQHVVNHASYHRGQVTTLLRQLGAAPPAPTDLMVFHRERSATTRP